MATAFLYSDGSLVLSSGDTPDSSKTLVDSYTGWDTATYTSSSEVPWYSQRLNITSASVEGHVAPRSTAHWFSTCNNLASFNLATLDTSNVTNMTYMFYGTIADVLDVGNFDTSKVTNMSYMFGWCENLTCLDLTSFNTKKVANMTRMFYSCKKLKTIYVSNNWSTNAIYPTSNSDYMFQDCTKLVGDVAYNSSYVNMTYAKYSGGYLTYAEYITPVDGEFLIDGLTLSSLARAVRQLTGKRTSLNPNQMAEEISKYSSTSWAGSLTFSGTYASATYYTAAGCSLVVDKSSGMAFLTIQGGTSNSYENIYYDSSTTYMKLPAGVTFLPTQTYGGGTSGATQRYYTAVFTGITGKINVAVDLGNYNGSYDYVRPTITMTYA